MQLVELKATSHQVSPGRSPHRSRTTRAPGHEHNTPTSSTQSTNRRDRARQRSSRTTNTPRIPHRDGIAQAQPRLNRRVVQDALVNVEHGNAGTTSKRRTNAQRPKRRDLRTGSNTSRVSNNTPLSIGKRRPSGSNRNGETQNQQSHEQNGNNERRNTRSHSNLQPRRQHDDRQRATPAKRPTGTNGRSRKPETEKSPHPAKRQATRQSQHSRGAKNRPEKNSPKQVPLEKFHIFKINIVPLQKFIKIEIPIRQNKKRLRRKPKPKNIFI